MTSQYLSDDNTTNAFPAQGPVTPDDEDYQMLDRVTATIGYCLCVVIVIFNTVVIVTLLRRRKDRNRLHFFILHLAIADILVGMVTVLGDSISYTLEMVWYGGDVLCRVYSFAAMAVLCASNNLLIGMSVDRFLAIKYPLKVMKIGNRMGRGFVIGAWLISVLLSIFFLPYSNGQNRQCFLDCPEHWLKTYMTIAAVVVYILPTVVIVVCYTGICVVIWQKWREGLKLSETSKLHNPSGVNGTARTNRGGGVLSKAKIKSIQMTLVICVAFFVCWTPYFVTTLVSVYHGVDFRVYQIMGILYPLNSAVNPVIFFLFNRKLFRSDTPSSDGGRSTDYQQTTVSAV